MFNPRQQAFQQLRTPCVELSSVALKFKANQVSAKTVLLALEKVLPVLQTLGSEDLLDEKLAEYAFFPLTHIFNQSQRLPASILELAVRSVQVLVSKGWRDKILPEMAKQLLILMGLLVSQAPGKQTENATDELKVASFECIATLIHHSAARHPALLANTGERNIVDQIVYQLLEALTETSSESVQISAASALLELNHAIDDRPLLASLLPRTVSTLVKVLRPSTQARRTRKVLVAYLELLRAVLQKLLTDEVISQTLARRGKLDLVTKPKVNQSDILDQSWLDATTPQIDLALVQVAKLRTHEGPEVAESLLDLCLLVIEECPKTLDRSLPRMVETLAILSRSSDSSAKAKAALRHLMISQPDVADMLSAKFHEWSLALPRVMQGNDDKPKQQMLGQIATAYFALADNAGKSSDLSSKFASVLVDSVSAGNETAHGNPKPVNEMAPLSTNDLVQNFAPRSRDFTSVILHHQSQDLSTETLKDLVDSLKMHPFSQQVSRSLVDYARDPDVNRSLSAAWLALRILKQDGNDLFDVGDVLQDGCLPSELQISRPFLVSDLYSAMLPHLLQSADVVTEDQSDWRLTALSLECLVLQANQLGRSYRPELVETLFPVLALLSSSNTNLQHHGMVAMDLLAAACEYESAAQMLIENVDYLVNAISLQLNAFDVTRGSLQVLTMMIRLCGARLLPHLDDLIGSVFGSLDNFHGYPTLVEHLFGILKLLVLESSKVPSILAIEAGQQHKGHQVKMTQISGIEDILNDLRARRARKARSNVDHEDMASVPRRPWASIEDGKERDTQEDTSNADEGDGNSEELEHSTSEKEPALSKSHQLLLNIARSTIPHLSSPSAKVRLTLLELLQEICPLLAGHENSFLPLVNSIWPAIIPRLLGRSDNTTSVDLAYNVRAAALTVSTICRTAGDFMASRIESIFSELEALFKSTYSNVTKSRKRAMQAAPSKNITIDLVTSGSLTDRGALRQQGLNIQDPSTDVLYQGIIRTSDAQILEALVELLLSVLENVRISQDNADKIFVLLGPLMEKEQAVRDALSRYNEDAFWLMERRQAYVASAKGA